MVLALRWIGDGRGVLRGAAGIALALATAGCGAVQNAMPDPANFRLPDRYTFFPTSTAAYAPPVSAGAVGPGDLVDAQGVCAGGGSAATDAPRGVSLEMSECEVVRALGPPQSVEISPVPGQRRSTPAFISSSAAGSPRSTALPNRHRRLL
jgi:hypothetical protein